MKRIQGGVILRSNRGVCVSANLDRAAGEVRCWLRRTSFMSLVRLNGEKGEIARMTFLYK